MTKLRLTIFSTTIIIVGLVGWLLFQFAKGYRVNDKLKLIPNGLLVIKSDPDGAQIFINGELKTATNSTIPLPPGTYDITLKKEGFLNWDKRLDIDAEIVTEYTAHLFKLAPSLSATTFNGAIDPLPSNDMTKIAYVVPNKPNEGDLNKEFAGLWVMEIVDLPLGFSRDPRRVTDGDLTEATFVWSEDDREILLTTKTGRYLLDTGKFTPQNQLTNVLGDVNEIELKWKKEKELKLNSQIKSLPDEMKDVIGRKARAIVFSPDEDMVLYTASASATLSDDLIKPVPGASTQKQDRDIKDNHTYIYDIKEDRNFLVDSNSSDLIVDNFLPSNAARRLTWFPTSRHLLLAEKDKITVMDYDSTNKKEVYKGSFLAPNAFPTLSTGRILILTNLGAEDTLPNIYSLTIK